MDSSPPCQPSAGRSEREQAIEVGRRDSDWGGVSRSHEEDLTWAAKRAAVTMAAATLRASDGATGAHSDDVVHLCDAIAEELCIYGNERAELLAAAQLHDIGKVAIPHEVLNKPGPLDEREWGLIREHTVVGEQILQSVAELRDVGRLVRHSHERWDGGGYPDGLSGQQIPLGSRVVFCADAFHAIRSDRPYRRGRSAEAALQEVQDGAGSQFDPDVVGALAKAAEQLRLTVRGGPGGLMATLRSRRLVALLLTLAVSGSALAAGAHMLRRDRDGAAERTAPVSNAAPVSRAAPVSKAAPASKAAHETSGVSAALKRRASTPETAGPQRGMTRRASPGIPATSAATRRSPTPGTGTSARRAAPTAATSASATQAAARARNRRLRPSSPGRSGEAPRRPAQAGKPAGTGAGRSDEAPGKPSRPIAPAASSGPAKTTRSASKHP